MRQIKNPNYSEPMDKHCSNCMSCLRESIGHWCSEIDEPISDDKWKNHSCKHWEWVVPKYVYE
jgi:hypothetical protein